MVRLSIIRVVSILMSLRSMLFKLDIQGYTDNNAFVLTQWRDN